VVRKPLGFSIVQIVRQRSEDVEEEHDEAAADQEEPAVSRRRRSRHLLHQ
jgi:hypothetical protein